MVNYIRNCGIPQCKLCRLGQLDTNCMFNGNLSKEIFNINFNQTCKTSRVVYLITCKHEDCNMKYVGKTSLTLHRRLALHRGHIVAGTEAPVMFNHFTKVHQPSDMQIKAIELCTVKNIDERERYWIDKLNVAFPYGLNDRLSKKGIQDVYSHVMENTSCNTAVYELFDKIPSKRTKKGGRKRNGIIANGGQFDPDLFLRDLIELDNGEDKKLFIYYVRNVIMHLNNGNTKILFIHLAGSIKDRDANFTTYSGCNYNEYTPYLVKDLCLAKLKKSFVPKIQKQHFMVFEFVNKYMDTVNINKVIGNKKIMEHFPVRDKNLSNPGIAYKYSNTIRGKVTNYKKVVQEGITPNTCDCHLIDPSFVDDHSGHVFTGNLEIVVNNELRMLLKRGLNYREVKAPDKNKVLQSLISGIDSYISKIANLCKIAENSFRPWKMEIMKLLKLKIEKLTPYNYNNVLSKARNKNDLVNLQEKYVFIPTDKAGNNITIVCKKLYMESMDHEILSDSTFLEINDTPQHILAKHKEFLEKFNLKTSGNIPYLYWIGKLHKNPIGKRFITSGKGGSLEELSKMVGICLKAILSIISTDSKRGYKKLGINKCFVINNKDPILKFMRENNQNIRNNSSVQTFDFSTLYTSIPQNKLKQQISKLIRSVFKLRKKSYITVSGKHAYLAQKQSRSNFSVTANDLVKCITFVVDNGFIVYKRKLFRQKLGIPMGTNSAPYLANIFLYCYEANYIENLKNSGRSAEAKLISATFRYQDDCIVFNDAQLYNHVATEIYPPEMVLKETNVSPMEVNYLDLNIQCINNTFSYKSYDKRKDYNFEIINYSDLSGNIPINQSYGVFTSQLIRFCDINGSFDNFINDIKILVDKLLCLGYKAKLLKAKFLKFYKHEIHRWAKYDRDLTAVVDMFPNGL